MLLKKFRSKLKQYIRATLILRISVVIVSFIATIFSIEIYIRHVRPDLESDRLYRLAHCFEDRFLLLCPSVNGEFLRPDKNIWKLHTDQNSQRITDFSNSKTLPTIWWIGDSITMGYLLNDIETAPAQFRRNSRHFNVQNLGSDSIGTIGIWYRLKKALHIVDDSAKPIHVFWIYNTSDFVDDLKDIRIQDSILYRVAFRIHYQISKYSTFYLLLRSASTADMNHLPSGFLEAPTADHPTFKNLLSFKKYLKQNNLSVTILVYPGFDPLKKGPAMDDPTTESLIEFLNKHQDLTYFDYIDMRPIFDKLTKQNVPLYLPIDGHPNQKAAALFAEAALNYIKQLK